MNSKEFFDVEFRLSCLKDYEQIRQRRNSFKGKPDEYEKLNIMLDRMFSSFYRNIGVVSN